MITLFTGDYTLNWPLSGFQQVARFAQNNHIDRLCIKVADGPNPWYGGIQQGFNMLSSLHFPILPFIYSYGGDTLQQELTFARQASQIYGSVCLDVESQWDSHPDYAQALLKANIPHLAISTWANPAEHAWNANIAILGGHVEEWSPQAYYDVLYDKMLAQWPTHMPLSPALSVEFPGAIDSFPLLCRLTGQGGCPLFVWHYLSAKGPSYNTFAQGVQAYLQALPPPGPSKAQQDSAVSEWLSTGGNLPIKTGIGGAWQELVYTGKRPGPPISKEYQTVDWNGNPIVAQEFAHARCEWTNGKARWFNETGEIYV